MAYQMLSENQSTSTTEISPNLESDKHDQLRNQIVGWFKDEEISYEERSTRSQISYFQLKANVQDFPIYVQELNQKRGCILVHSFLTLDHDKHSTLIIRTPEERKALHDSIFSLLNAAEFSYLLSQNYEDKRWITIQRILYVDNLTREKLLGEVKDLRLRFRNIVGIIDQFLGVSQETKPII
jgi:hypothetical protein